MAIEGEMGCKQGCLLFATSDTRTKLANKEVKRPHSPNRHIYTKDYLDWKPKGFRVQIKSKVSQVYYNFS